MELNDFRKSICFRKSGATGKQISVCNVTEKLMEHGIHCLPSSNINDVTIATTMSHWFQSDVNGMLFCQSAKKQFVIP